MDALNPRAIKSLVFATAQSVGAVVLTYLLVNSKKKGRVCFGDKLAILWFVYDAIVHLTLVGGPRQLTSDLQLQDNDNHHNYCSSQK